MSKVQLKVQLLKHTPDPEETIAAAAKLCYSPVGVDELLNNLTPEKTEKFVEMLADLKHESPFEHVSFTFAAEGVSRSLTHQLVRHRIASFSQQSQRYVPLDDFDYIVPEEIAKNEIASGIFIDAMKDDQRAYDGIVHVLKLSYVSEGMNEKAAEKKAIEDARYVFPNACETKIVFTMNVRSLWNFFNHRCCERAQWEIRALANEMLKAVKEVAPKAFKNAGKPCMNGVCKENGMQCDWGKSKGIITQKQADQLIKDHYRSRNN
jgi:thymidylate synthase (FAD)